MIGKSVKLGALQKIDKKVLPVNYTNKKSSWIYRKFLNNGFLKILLQKRKRIRNKKNLPRKVVLFLDNAPSLPDKDVLWYGEIRAIFSLPTLQIRMQPLDQDVLEDLKNIYRRIFLEYLVQSDDESIENVWISVNMRDTIYLIADYREEIQSATLNNVIKMFN